MNGLADLVYLAHEARYKATGKFVAFSEGNTGFSNPPLCLRVGGEGGWFNLDIDDENGVPMGIVPIIYFKAAVGLLAMHNTAFTTEHGFIY